MAKIRITFYITTFLSLFFNFSQAQIVRDVNLDLQSNSSINDIKYNDAQKKYFVGGDFASIGGITRKNLAVLDESLLINNQDIISSMTGQILTLESDSNYLYIGGDFTSINGMPSNGFVIYNLLTNTFVNNSTSIISSSNGVVSDIQLTDNHEMILVGSFDFMANGLQRKNIVAVSTINFSYLDNIFNNVQIESFSPSSLKIFKTSSMYVITGDHVKKGNNSDASGIKFSLTGQYIGQIIVADDNNKLGRELIQVKDNLFSYSRKPGQTTEIVITDINNDVMYTRSPNPNNAPSSCYGNQLPDKDQEIYNNEVFYIQDYSPSTTVIERYGLEVSDSIQRIVDFTSKWCTPVSNDQGGNSDTRKLIIANDKLFYHDQRLKKVENHQTNNKSLVAFCLEPFTPVGGFIKHKPDPCEKVKFEYKIHEVKGAIGYEWGYTGTGARIKRASEPASVEPQAFSQDTVIQASDAFSVVMEFDRGFTDGEVFVRAYTICNNFQERIYSKEIRVPIVNNASNISFSLNTHSDYYDCKKDSVVLSATTNLQNYELYWKLDVPSALPKYGSPVTMYKSEFDATQYQYNFELRYESLDHTACVKKDCVLVTFRNDLPDLQVASNYLTFDCNNSDLILSGTSQDVNDVLEWNINGSYFPNPATINSVNDGIGTYYLKGMNGNSFCIDSIPITVANDFATPLKPLINGATFSQIIPVGEVTCANPVLLLQASNDVGQNNTFYWLNENQEQVQSVELSADHLNDVIHVVGQNGCESSFPVFITVNNTAPGVIHMNDTLINCSIDTISLIHPDANYPANGWLGANGEETIQVSQIGTYFYEFINPLNGCSAYDTVQITKSNEIFLNFTAPDFVCQNEPFNVGAIALGVENPEYTWSNGQIGANASGIGGLDNMLIVSVVDNSLGCVGSDTVHLLTAPPIQNEVQMYLSCDEEFIYLTSLVVAGGIEPFAYSVDGINFQSNNTIANLLPGDYFISIKDFTNCVYEFPITISEAVQAPNLHFLASTYNKPQDFVALVNTTTFGGYDTVYWVLPPSIQFEYETDSMRFVSASDTGYFDISLVGVIDTCVYTFTKQIYFGEKDSVYFTQDLIRGIQNLDLYPNPNTGTFSVDVTFGIEQHFVMYIADIAGNIVANSSRQFGISHVENFDISMYPSGTYILRIISDFDTAYFPFVKN